MLRHRTTGTVLLLGGKDGAVNTIGSLSTTLAVLCMATGCNANNKTATQPETQDEAAAQATPPTTQTLAAPEGSTRMPDSVIVTVEGETLTSSMADQMVQQMASRQGVPPQMMQRFIAQAGPQLRQQVTDQFVDKVLLAREAEKRDITPSEQEVDKMLADMSEQLPEGMTLEQAVQAQGASMEEVRSDVADNLKLRKLYEAETKDVEAVTDEAVKQFYKENTDSFSVGEQATARHILIKCEKDAGEEKQAEAKANAEAIHKQLAGGADFAELAKAESECPSSAKGGELGTFGRGQMAGPFEEAAFSQAIGELGPVVKTDFGYHVIKVTDRTAATNKSLDEVSENIRNRLEAQARNEDFGKFAKSLRVGADIEYAEPQQ